MQLQACRGIPNFESGWRCPSRKKIYCVTGGCLDGVASERLARLARLARAVNHILRYNQRTVWADPIKKKKKGLEACF